MPRPITNKAVQLHFNCACGYNLVDHYTTPIKWADLPKSGIVRRRDKKTGKPFLLQKIKAEVCDGHDDFNDD